MLSGWRILYAVLHHFRPHCSWIISDSGAADVLIYVHRWINSVYFIITTLQLPLRALLWQQTLLLPPSPSLDQWVKCDTLWASLFLIFANNCKIFLFCHHLIFFQSSHFEECEWLRAFVIWKETSDTTNRSAECTIFIPLFEFVSGKKFKFNFWW